MRERDNCKLGFVGESALILTINIFFNVYFVDVFCKSFWNILIVKIYCITQAQKE